jgi:indolepyruvate ferredoxin oxidoreductase
VFGIWYGKGPGVDRTGDVFRTANMLGTSALGGVLAVSGDDHAAQSSMYPHQTDGIFQSASMPVLQPASVREVIELGLAGFELSRFCGPVGGPEDDRRSGGNGGHLRPAGCAARSCAPDDLPVPAMAELGLAAAWPGQRAELERRLIEERLPAARAWARANRHRPHGRGGSAQRFGIVTVGKAHQDLMQAFADLGWPRTRWQAMGISVYKVAMSWPLETDGALRLRRRPRGSAGGRRKAQQRRGAAEGRAVWPGGGGATAARQRQDRRHGAPVLPEVSEFTPLIVARALAARFGDASCRCCASAGRSTGRACQPGRGDPIRRPYFCSGCPAQYLDRTPEGSRERRRHRLPRDGAGPARTEDDHLLADGRRRRAVDGRGAVLQRPGTCSRTWATAPTSIPACWPSAPRWRPRPTSPTRSSTTTRSR